MYIDKSTDYYIKSNDMISIYTCYFAFSAKMFYNISDLAIWQGREILLQNHHLSNSVVFILLTFLPFQNNPKNLTPSFNPKNIDPSHMMESDIFETVLEGAKIRHIAILIFCSTITLLRQCSMIIFNFSIKICCNPLLELHHRCRSNEGPWAKVLFKFQASN